MSRKDKQWLVLGLDVLLVPVALVGAFMLRGRHMGLGESPLADTAALVLLMALSGLIAFALGLHRVQLKSYENTAMGKTLLHAVLLGIAIAILDRIGRVGTPPAVFVVFTLLQFLLAVGTRIVALQFLLRLYRSGEDVTRVLIYGAERDGQQLAAALRTDLRVVPVAFVDDNTALHGTLIAGLHVYAPPDLAMLVRDRGVTRVLLAMPGASRPQIARLSRRLEDMGLEVHALPSFAELAGSGRDLVHQLAPVMPDRLLGRAPLVGGLPDNGGTYAGRVVMVTGAGGSIGSELCRQILGWRPRRLVLFEISELALYSIEQELRELAGRSVVEVEAVLGSVADQPLVRSVLAEHRVEVVLHAAAYKHVPIVERNPAAGFANNVIGTQTLAQAAIEAGVGLFVLVSTDKAVRPTNMMGASKRLAELVVQDFAARRAPGGTLFSMVRFGNVIGSSGSVVPLFQDQIARGGPVTLTHREVTRYFMTIPEAARLVLLAGGFAQGGDVFVLDMGDPVRIHDLARQMIEAQGYRVRDADHPDGDIEIAITGLRPGEKLHEELLIGDGQITTPHPKILRAREAHLSEIEVASCLRDLRAALAESDAGALRAVVARWVEGGAAIAARGRPGKGR
ncbi:MAG: polysaccharide biosynthesis protein [Rubellimicrobium sp.]|nr:polysaccharide biosynthesis protein [Rubellimicrobium sp.]